MCLRFLQVLPACAVAFALGGCAQSPSSLDDALPAAASAKITVLYDAFGHAPDMHRDWGYAALIEYRGQRILFDTGNNAETFEHNVRARGVDLSKLDFVVMSHRHGDHMGGMSYLLRANPSVPIYAPKEGFGVYGADLPGTFYRRDENLPAELRYFGGDPPETLHFGSAWPQANIHLIDKTSDIAPGVHLVSLVSDTPGTLELRELSLVLETPEGLVIVVGCSHPGITRIVEAARAYDPRVYLIAGGLHLVNASDPDIARVVTALHDTYAVSFVAPGHCTGEATFSALRNAFGDHDLYAGLGITLRLGAHPVSSDPATGATDPTQL